MSNGSGGMATTDGRVAVATRSFFSFSDVGLVVVFSSTLFLSALLLFAVQPMFAKMALPLLGGAPNVWNTAMVFFQATLLAGYIYAHLLSRFASPGIQIVAHLFVLAAGLLFLPITIASGWTPSTDAPAMWLIGLFAMSLGIPFFAISANAPLLQKWFSYTDHHQSHDPYFLYAASNVGSLLALAAYPLVVEPGLGLVEQSIYWKTGYLLLIAAIAIVGVAGLRRGRVSRGREENEVALAAGSGEAVTWRQRLYWIALAFIPSSLMLGVTSHLTANVAAAPFLWVAPLALYLVTFIFAFTTRPVLPTRLVEAAYVPMVLVGVIYVQFEVFSFVFTVVAHLAVFFVIAQLCHNRLSGKRPGSKHLTEFFLCMSIGGVLGGGFNALAAPLLFNQVIEYPLIMVLSAFALASKWPTKREAGKSLLWGASVCLMMLALLFAAMKLLDSYQILAGMIIFGIGAFVVSSQKDRPFSFTSGLIGITVAIMVLKLGLAPGHERSILQERSFFGVVRVAEIEAGQSRLRQFVHGSTVHNIQLIDENAAREPLAYYAKEGPFGQAVSRLRADRGQLNVGVIGLGAGALACHAEAGEQWTYYEIDPLVADMAISGDSFTYMPTCQPDARVEVGDARLLVGKEPDGAFDLIIVDAFSSDSIPAHLITREALELYRTKLEEGGLIFFHTSNRAVDVTSVAVSLARVSGLDARTIKYKPDAYTPFAEHKFETSAVLIGAPTDLDRVLAGADAWSHLVPNRFVKPWTDDYSNIVGAIAAHIDGGGTRIPLAGNID